ncbi:thioredoxin-like protein [Mycena pura]|uniref:Thioredoxin-like protein n=1 Tax=Mycena pura TaxID=153505 RepID=A0AAD6VRE3_9AGAR|nr:thioredoxin-like protein [Mycena pura]
MSFSKTFSPALREIRILCSQTGSASASTRQFILSKYPLIKQHNPDLPVLIREASGTPARIFARFEMGAEKHLELDNMSAQEVESKVASLLGL